MKQVIGFGRGETSQGLLIFAAVYDPSRPFGLDAKILRFCDRAFTLEHWQEHNLFFEGSILELGYMAFKRLDPSMLHKSIGALDYDYEVVREMYEQVEHWLRNRLGQS